MKAPLYDISPKLIKQIDLPASKFGAKFSPQLISQATRVFLSNQRKARATTKNRSQVAGTTKKVWAQKGTGRARHGSRKAPIFVGGGVAHGPTGQQNYKLKMSQKMKRQALASLLSYFAQAKKIIVIEKFSTLPPKTKSAVSFLDKLRTKTKSATVKKIAIITSRPLPNLKRAFGNIPNISLFNLSSLNTYQLARHQLLIFSLKSLNQS